MAEESKKQTTPAKSEGTDHSSTDSEQEDDETQAQTQSAVVVQIVAKTPRVLNDEQAEEARRVSMIQAMEAEGGFNQEYDGY